MAVTMRGNVIEVTANGDTLGAVGGVSIFKIAAIKVLAGSTTTGFSIQQDGVSGPVKYTQQNIAANSDPFFQTFDDAGLRIYGQLYFALSGTGAKAYIYLA